MTEPDSDNLTIDDATVGVEWWARFYGLSVWTIRGMAAGGHDPRLPAPLAIPGPYRWLKSAALAHIAALPTVER